MKILSSLAFLMLLNSNAFAFTATCSVDNLRAVVENGDIRTVGSRLNVPVAIVRGAELVDESPVQLAGVIVSAKMNLGDQFETQTSFQMKFGELISSIRPLARGHYDLSSNGVRFQCAVN